MQAKPDIKETHIEECSVLVIAGHSNMRSGLVALLRSLPKVVHIYLADNYHDVVEIIETKPIRLVILDDQYLGNNLSELLNELQNKGTHVIALDDWENSTQGNTGLGGHIGKGVRPEKLLQEIQKRC